MFMFYNDPENGPMYLDAYHSIETIEQLEARTENKQPALVQLLKDYGHLLEDRTGYAPADYTGPGRFMALIRHHYGETARTLPALRRLAQMCLFYSARVEAESIADFLERYYKPDRYHGRGEDYAAILLASYQENYESNGYKAISHHDSATGRTVSYFGPNINRSNES
jgi:hypothetical protein